MLPSAVPVKAREETDATRVLLLARRKSATDAAANFREHVPRSAAWVFERYEPEMVFGPIRIYGRAGANTLAKRR